MSGSNYGRDTSYPTIYSCFSQSFHTISTRLHWEMRRLFPGALHITILNNPLISLGAERLLQFDSLKACDDGSLHHNCTEHCLLPVVCLTVQRASHLKVMLPISGRWLCCKIFPIVFTLSIRHDRCKYKNWDTYISTKDVARGREQSPLQEGCIVYIAGPANQNGCIIFCVGNLADEKL
jgi:hypothetical protein